MLDGKAKMTAMGEITGLAAGATPLWLGLGTLILAAISSLVWLAGLVIVTHGTKPGERPAILRAYGASLARRRQLLGETRSESGGYASPDADRLDSGKSGDHG